MKPRFSFSLPNCLSYLRILIGFILPLLLFLLQDHGKITEFGLFWWALGLFIFGAFTDFWDGWLARRQKLETPLGKILDPLADKIFILGSMASFAAKGLYSYWYLVPIFIREISITFCRILWLQKGRVIAAERAGKLKLVSQVVSILFSFLYLARPFPLFSYLNYFFLLLAVLATVYSGVLFFLRHRELLQDQDFARAVASLGVGYLQPCPGTYGTLLGLIFVPLVAHDFLLHLFIFLFFLALAYGMIPQIGLGDHEDPLEIVIDEVCGILLAFFWVPIHPLSLLAGFLLFRFFDVKKIFPIHWLETKKGVHGIMLDDLGAVIYTWMILKIIFR